MKGNDKVILMNDIFDENEAAQYMKSYMFINALRRRLALCSS